jgi:two-component sensor histidine kinase
MNLRKRAVWVGLLLFCTGVGACNFGHLYLDDLARGTSGTLVRRLMEEMTGAYSAFVLLPLVLAITHRVPFTRASWPVALGANALGLIAYTIGHTTLMALSRAVLSPALGLGPYEYGNLAYRYPMEAAGDVVWYSLIAGSSYVAVRLQAARAAHLRATELQRRLAEAQLENLRLQLNPHFLFNTLNAISSVMYDDVRKADAMLAKLSDFLRTVLAASGVANVRVDEELAVERQYVEIMTTRLERRLDLRVTVAEAARDAHVPFMLLQPLIENSIRHGMSDRPSLTLEIDARRDGSQTVIEVRDDGCGCVSNPTAGIGLGNVRSRLMHLYGDAASFSLEPRDGGGTRAIVIIPFSNEALA